MNRRDFLKQMAAAGTSFVARAHAIGSPQESGQSETGAAVATAIRGLVEKNGRLFQPIQIRIPQQYANSAAAATGNIRIDGVASEQRIVPGSAILATLVPAVQSERVCNVIAEIADKTIFSGNVKLKPVRKVTVYVLPHSHNDIGYTDIQTAVQEKQLANIQLGIDLARKTAEYPEGSRFVWNMEGIWAADLWMRRMPEAKRAEFIDAVRRGWVALNGMYTNELTGCAVPKSFYNYFGAASKSPSSAK